MAVLIAIDKLPASALMEAREACKMLGLEANDWVSGIPASAPVAVISGLDHGVRRIPQDLVALVDGIPGMQLVLCAQEPLVRPRIVVGDGRVCVLGPPIGRANIVAALRAVIAPPPPPLDGQARRFEVLRRAHWVAWARGSEGPAISLHEERGTTVVIGEVEDRSAIADAMASSQSDADREAALEAVAGRAGVAHLTHDANEWVMYWPNACPLWLYSPNRVPARWNVARGIAGVANRRMLRLPAFPADQLVGAWSEVTVGGDPLAAIHQVAVEGGAETIVGLEEVAAHHPQITGVVMEVR
ncbi:MAG TPA: hypothetical protein VFD36_01740 [Kofleriaceae bacterium]|nr:hypothetical protein [Kofleriaceae bacterium]